jgi:hypothetical protein
MAHCTGTYKITVPQLNMFSHLKLNFSDLKPVITGVKFSLKIFLSLVLKHATLQRSL